MKICRQSNMRGLTLVEAMIVLAILSIISTVGIPSFIKMITHARVTSDLNEINSLMRFARFKAIDEERLVVLCPAADYQQCGSDWNVPKIVFFDLNYNDYRDPDEAILISSEAVEKTLRMSSNRRMIKFYESGVTASPASIKICTDEGDLEFTRQLTLSLQGKIKLSKDRNRDGIHEGSSGAALNCSV
ncbi:GspH/FimT family pseudopilin [Glaciecola sp. MH2013]|uniref:GspH/FimT family pseudopilin n=1 Tax=Glaciecola sp. MH2013 TaxID=2785524 RepID=UPI00189E7A9F|nr:GspH/FimT family pseudopilin [Glaciecola sp. MH2013]MBF7071779.1 GspH/FimT family pseudopilin [Glaciecola sp. MH2013]